MLIVDSNRNIKVSKDDTAELEINIVSGSINVGSTIVFAVKRTTNDSEEVFRKPIEVEGNETSFTVKFETKDFEEMPVGVYYYDITILESGKVNTLFFPAKFEVAEVVRNVK